MIQEKRSRVPPKPFFFSPIPKQQKSKNLEKKQRLANNSYTIIGLPPKYPSSHDIYLLPANLPCSQQEDHFVMDLAWLNEFHVFKEVKIEDQNLVIQVERRTDSRFPRLKAGVNRLMKVKNPGVKSWARVIRSFYQSCKNVSKQLIGQDDPDFNVKFEIKEEFNVKLEIKKEFSMKLEDEKSEDNFSKSTFETLMRDSCHDGVLHLKSYFRGFESRLTQITANKNLVKMLGFNMQSFCSHVLNEGLPEMFVNHDETNSQFFLKMLEELSEIDVKTPWKRTSLFDASIKTKTGYMMKVKVQVQLLISFQNGRLETDLQFHFRNYDGAAYEPLEGVKDKERIEESFLEAMKEREKEAKDFLQTYYNHTAYFLYSNLDRVCGIKEL